MDAWYLLIPLGGVIGAVVGPRLAGEIQLSPSIGGGVDGWWWVLAWHECGWHRTRLTRWGGERVLANHMAKCPTR